jgi:hypothetical protein
MQYEITDSVAIICGDVGMGFHKFEYYKELFSKLNSKLKKTNNYLFAFRGNHDNPVYFNEKTQLNKFSNIKLLEDYSIIETSTKVVLVVGGAYSIDRYDRKMSRDVDMCFWENEFFVYNKEKLDEINKLYPKRITHVLTHSAPALCTPSTKEGLNYWFNKDSQLYYDIDNERKNHSLLKNNLLFNEQPIRQWCYGHYHFSKTERMEGINFCLLDINQLMELR